VGEGQDKKLDIPEYAKCGLLRDAIAAKVLVEQAARDSVIVGAEEVDGALDNQIMSTLYDGFGGDKAAMEKRLGKTIYQIKEEYRPFIKDKLTWQKMYAEVVKNVAITPKEVETYFNSVPEDQKTNIPASVEVGEIVLKPEVDPEVEAYTKNQLEDIRKQIVEGGKSFATLAQVYSEDGSANNGGEMNLNRKDSRYDSRFVSSAFKLQPGEISPVFRSSFGYHIIEMMERNGDDAKIRYFVLIPKFTSSDYEKAISKMDSVRNLLVTSKLSFSEAVNKVSNDDISKQSGGMIRDRQTGSSMLSVDNITDPDLALEIADLEVGQYSKPQLFVDETDRSQKVRILYVKSKQVPHQINLKDDYGIIQNYALQIKKSAYLNDWLAEKSKGYYIKIDPKYVSNCDEVKMFIHKN
jgi:peptidyl-prolyl cis-trans isomerase SurA